MTSAHNSLFASGSKLLRRALVACALGLVAYAGAPAALGIDDAEAAKKKRPGIFNSIEIRKKGLKPFPKWTGALDRFVSEKAKEQGKCKPSKKRKCFYATWLKMIADLKEKDPWQKIKGVNAFMNRAPYVVDKMNWGIKDYWSTPGQFFARYGDCEDYAIVKFLSLRALGFPSKQMRIVVVQDLNLKVAHAILALYVRGKVLVLDNQIKRVVEAKSIRHYRPIFSLNEEGWWLHRKKKA